MYTLQARATFVYRLLYKNTMEEKIYKVNLKKEELFHRVSARPKSWCHTLYTPGLHMLIFAKLIPSNSHIWLPCTAMQVINKKSVKKQVEEDREMYEYSHPRPMAPEVFRRRFTATKHDEDETLKRLLLVGAGSQESGAQVAAAQLAGWLADYHLHESMLPEDPMEVRGAWYLAITKEFLWARGSILCIVQVRSRGAVHSVQT